VTKREQAVRDRLRWLTWIERGFALAREAGKTGSRSELSARRERMFVRWQWEERIRCVMANRKDEQFVAEFCQEVLELIEVMGVLERENQVLAEVATFRRSTCQA
jgi:hypothetical protein